MREVVLTTMHGTLEGVPVTRLNCGLHVTGRTSERAEVPFGVFVRTGAPFVLQSEIEGARTQVAKVFVTFEFSIAIAEHPQNVPAADGRIPNKGVRVAGCLQRRRPIEQGPLVGLGLLHVTAESESH